MCDDLGRMFDHSPLAFVVVVVVVVVVFEAVTSSRSLFPLFMPGSVHSGSVSRDDCGQVFPNKLCVSLFPDRFPCSAWKAA